MSSGLTLARVGCWWFTHGQENTKVEMMQNLQVLNSFCSFEIPDIFLFETRFRK